MTNNDSAAFHEFLTSALAFWKQDVNSFVMDVWWGALKPFEIDTIRGAFSTYAQVPDDRGHFAPFPNDIIQIITGRTADMAMTAWSKVERATRTIGPYQTVVFDDPYIHVVIDEMGGWVAMGNKTEKDFQFLRNEFISRYQGYRTNPSAPVYPKRLIGISDMHAISDDKMMEPVLLGDPQAASRVLALGSDHSTFARAQLASAPNVPRIAA